MFVWVITAQDLNIIYSDYQKHYAETWGFYIFFNTIEHFELSNIVFKIIKTEEIIMKNFFLNFPGAQDDGWQEPKRQPASAGLNT